MNETTIRFDRLRHLRDIVLSTPTERFNLKHIKYDSTEHTPCGSVACAIGWAMQDPELSKTVPFKMTEMKNVGYSVFSIEGELGGRYPYQDVGEQMFGISYDDATNLFAPRCGSVFDAWEVTSDGHKAMHVITNDKELFLHRLQCFFKQREQQL